METQTLIQKESSFNEIAKDVIKRSFRSAICIDNEYASAYSQSGELNFDEPRALYYSFRNEGLCDLDVFEFKSIEESWKAHMGENKDLMILDWELDPGERYDSTLQILDDVIVAKKIPFIVIYTNTGSIESVAQTIITRFNPVTNEDLDKFKRLFNEKMAPLSADDAVDFDSLTENPTIFFEYIHVHSKRDETEARIFEWISKSLSIKPGIDKGLKAKVVNLIGSVFGPQCTGREIEYFSFLILREDVLKNNFPIQRIKVGKSSYVIDNAVTIIIFPKKDKDGGITPEKLFNEFAEAIISDPHNFISLLSLEFKDNIRENFSKIGSKFSKIDEDAFFYHMGNYSKGGILNKGAIYDFILRGWIYELFQQKAGEKSEVLSFIDDRYEAQKKNEGQIGSNLVDELVKYSAYISTTDLSHKTTKQLWFGDIFKNDKSEYFLCITPHCDCSIPSKISKNYYFIKGAVEPNKKLALETAEQGYGSFIIDVNPICIEWKRKPFTSFVNSHTIDSVVVSYSGKDYALKYVTSLKENYTQRISNEAFGYGYRVGIDLPHLRGGLNTED